MVKDRKYPDLLSELYGKRVLIWTCNTCARLSNGIGGDDSAKRLSERLSKDGVDVIGVSSVSASCLERKVRSKYDLDILNRVDIVLSLTCNVGAISVGRVFGSPIINPVITLGPGIITEDGELLLVNDDTVSDMKKEIGSRGLDDSPFV